MSVQYSTMESLSRSISKNYVDCCRSRLAYHLCLDRIAVTIPFFQVPELDPVMSSSRRWSNDSQFLLRAPEIEHLSRASQSI